MGEWKTYLSLRIKQDLRVEMEQFAALERRTLGNVGEILISWAFEQAKKAGSIVKLINKKPPVPRNPQGNYKRTWVPKS